jgi:hypothetical protein
MALMGVAERLAADFGDRLPNSTVIRVLTDCADEHPERDPMVIEQVARARLERVAVEEKPQ